MSSNDNKVLNEEIEDNMSPTEDTIELLKTIKDNTNNCIQMTSNLLFRLKDNQLSTKNGNSLMALKNKVFVSYLMDLTFLTFNKICGQRLEGSDVIKRLVEKRTVLERMKPIEHKLKYTFDKLIKTSMDGTVDPNDPMRFRPNLQAIVSDNNDNAMAVDEREDNSDEEISDQMNAKPKSTDVYVPPKVSQMRFDVEDDQKQKAFERAKKRAMNSSIITELRHEFDSRPQEVFDSMNTRDHKMNRLMKDRTTFEEEYMTRMTLTKKQRNEMKKMQTMTSLASGLTHFEDISALDMNNANDFEFQSKKRISKQKTNKKFKRNQKKFKK